MFLWKQIYYIHKIHFLMILQALQQQGVCMYVSLAEWSCLLHTSQVQIFFIASLTHNKLFHPPAGPLREARLDDTNETCHVLKEVANRCLSVGETRKWDNEPN